MTGDVNGYDRSNESSQEAESVASLCVILINEALAISAACFAFTRWANDPFGKPAAIGFAAIAQVSVLYTYQFSKGLNTNAWGSLFDRNWPGFVFHQLGLLGAVAAFSVFSIAEFPELVLSATFGAGIFMGIQAVGRVQNLLCQASFPRDGRGYSYQEQAFKAGMIAVGSMNVASLFLAAKLCYEPLTSSNATGAGIAALLDVACSLLVFQNRPAKAALVLPVQAS